MSDKPAGDKAAQQPGGNPWTLMFLVMLSFWLCTKRPVDPQIGLRDCGKNLHTLGVALEKARLGSDDGLYPAKLEEAMKGQQLPVCPVGKKGTYDAGYQPSADRRSYKLVCKGEHHKPAGVPSDYPRIGFGPHGTPVSGEESAAQGSPSPVPSASPSPKASPQESHAHQASPSPIPARPTPAPQAR